MSNFTALNISTLFFFLFLIFNSSHETNVTDYAALMAFKSHLILQPDNILSTNWNHTIHFCNWYGISCFNHSRVNYMQLSGLSLQGKISSDIANMTHLVVLDLSGNNFNGILPSELGFLQELRILNVTGNSFQGDIPVNLSKCFKLETLDLSFNFIEGNIPKELGFLSNLQHLALDHNNLTGIIPTSFGNFSKLEYFYLHENDLVDEIPKEIGKLSSLLVLGLRGNNLVGSIPSSIFNISTLQIVDLSINRLSGQLPNEDDLGMPNLERLFLDSNRISGRIPRFISNATRLNYLYLTENDMFGHIPNDFDRLTNLVWFEFEYNRISGNIPYGLFNITSLEILKTRHNYLSGELPSDLGNWLPNFAEIFLSHNQFSGEIPSSICNATNLVYLEASNNSFSGPVPMMLGNLVYLEHLNLQHNSLVNVHDSLEFLDSLVNCRRLQFLILESNPLSGILPESIGNLSSNLKVFTAISCELKGVIPHGLGNLSSLNYLGLSLNNLQGEVPSSFSRLQNLERVYLSRNQFEGSVPDVFCSISILGILALEENNFSGSIPTCIANLTQLKEITLASNKLNSTIPLGFWKIEHIEALNFSRNFLHGSIPNEVGNLKAVNIMDLSYNDFSGEIPDSIGSLQSLLTLDMSRNKFEGSIPSTLSNLIVIDFLDLSSNGLSGNIPASLGSLRDLKYLNLSFNRLEGEIPHTGVFKDITFEYLMGNPNLCGSPNLSLPLCYVQKKRRSSLVLKITIPISAILVLVFILCVVFHRKKRVKNATKTYSTYMGGHEIITYQELVQATEAFSESNLVGEGSSCKVYQAEFSDGSVAAIKVFNMHYAKALKNFDAECEVLRNVRHRNLVKVISTCSNLDFKAMILEFMPNGSLHDWLHSKSDSLSLVQRLDIVSDVAMAIEYLHHEYEVPIVHCDLKPANVLLDEDMTAHVADFGIAKILAHDHEFIQTKTLGTIGYMAPEYGLDGHVSTKGDVFSFGILLLETFTGKRPTDDTFKEDLSLHQWVKMVFPDALTEVLDSNLFSDFNVVKAGSNASINKNRDHTKEFLVPIIHVALLCLKELPEERIDMRGVTVQLKKIRGEVQKIYSK
ncbi:hypothetical protein ACJIZ3_014525 [Penstemon smallii]|uniref:non-specific serine/threonine protein kinase n=1 Tax=Penstemon smallii TaxID=265156 RepID=A0ABD3RJU7_9LAMI